MNTNLFFKLFENEQIEINYFDNFLCVKRKINWLNNVEQSYFLNGKLILLIRQIRFLTYSKYYIQYQDLDNEIIISKQTIKTSENEFKSQTDGIFFVSKRELLVNEHIIGVSSLYKDFYISKAFFIYKITLYDYEKIKHQLLYSLISLFLRFPYTPSANL